MLSLVAAMDKNRLIGRANKLPWYLPEDLRRFKCITMHKPIIMGRNTFESIGKPLPGRRNIVVSGNRGYKAENCETVQSLDQAVQLTAGATEALIIGGMQIYQYALPLVSRMYLTLIEHMFEGDAWFPEYDTGDWRLVESERHQHHQPDFFYQFNIYERASFLPPS